LPLFLPEIKTTAARIAFYEDLPLKRFDLRGGIEVLVLIEPEEVLSDGQIFMQLENVKAGVTLGIFSSPPELLRGETAARVRGIFGIKEPVLEPYLLRETGKALSLPVFDFPLPDVKRPEPDADVITRFSFNIEEKFMGLNGPALYSEIALFKTGGPPAPFVPLRLLKGSLDIERMDDEEKAYFVYWREEFRRGNILKTDEQYIRVYARELCLFAGGEDETNANFGELCRLIEIYGEILENIYSFLPRWALDFAIVYDIAANGLQRLAPYAKESGDSLLSDLYIHRRFIMENNPIDFGDIQLLIPAMARNYNMAHNMESVINAIDRYLRESFHLKLFEFFYPQSFVSEKRNAFPEMERSGISAYTVTGLRFSRHPPLIAFLESLYKYV
jgi:hypothetical protein